MDILSLPQEMLASVLKYVKFKQMIQIRKVSTFVDLVARKFKLPPMNFQHLRIYIAEGKCNTTLITNKANFDESKVIRKTYKEDSAAKIHRIDTLCIQGEHNVINVISKKFAEFLLKHRSKKIKHLSILDYKLDFEPELLRRILTTLQIQSLYLRLHVDNQDYSPYKNEVFEGLQFEKLLLEPLNGAFTSDITLKGLRNICAKRLPTILKMHKLNVNIYELEEFLEENITESLETANISWTFEAKAGNLGHTRAIEYVKGMNCLKSFRTGQYRNQFFDDRKSMAYSSFLTIDVIE